MTRKATMNQLFNLLQDEYNIKSASDIEAVLLDMFGGFIEQVQRSLLFMTRKATMNQLFNLLQDEYNIKSASDIEAVLLDMFGGFIEQAKGVYYL